MKLNLAIEQKLSLSRCRKNNVLKVKKLCVTHCRTPPPFECLVLFEWPLSAFFICRIQYLYGELIKRYLVLIRNFSKFWNQISQNLFYLKNMECKKLYFLNFSSIAFIDVDEDLCASFLCCCCYDGTCCFLVSL